MEQVGTDCRMAGLNRSLGVDPMPRIDWGNYLFNYTSALFGCGVVYEPLPGGVDAFPLTNTAVIGTAAPAFGPDDAKTLIDVFIGECALQLGVSALELDALQRHLEQAAAPIIDTSVSARLSECPTSAPDSAN
ncbi:MAG TPA: hypothetical protein VMG12_36905 [Polyangiaceae bacterium]|nr:hypothetical protein [Polyangiaceae bacterium]